MPRWMLITILVPLFTEYAWTQEVAAKRYRFQPVAKAGDRFHSTSETRQKMKAVQGKQVLVNTEQADSRKIEATVISVNSEGRPLELIERTTKHDRNRKMDAMGSLAAPESNTGPLENVELSYEFTNGHYEPSLRTGEASQELDIKLRSPRISVLDEEFLPTVPLAIGATQTIADQARLKAIFNEFGPQTTFLRPLKITLASVQKVNGKTYAMLRESAKLKTLLPIETGAEVEVILEVDLTVAYDLDNHYMRQAKVQSSGTGKLGVAGQTFDIKLSYLADTHTLKRGPAVPGDEP